MPPRRQWASAIRAISADVVRAAGDGRAAGGVVEERQRVAAVADHRDAERLEQLHGRRHVEDRLDARRGDEGRDARDGGEVGRDVGGVGKPRCTPPRPPVPMNRIPDGGRGGERAADRRRADRALDRADGQVARAELARLGREPLELVARSRPIRIRPSRTPIVAGIAPAARTAASLARPVSTPSGAGKPWATRVVSSATTARSSSSAVRTSSPTWIRSRIRASLAIARAASTPPAARSAPRPRARGPARRRASRRRRRRPPPSSRPTLDRGALHARRRRTRRRRRRA